MARKRSKKEVEARKAHRNAAFLPDFPDQVKAIAMRGLSDDEMAGVFGISPNLMQNWKRLYPGFKKAVEDGRTAADANVVMALYDRAIGYSHPEEVVKITEDGDIFTHERTKHYPPDHASIRTWLTNRQKEHWKDRTSHEVGGSKDMPDIGIGVKDETKEELVSSILSLITPRPDDESD